VQIHELYVRVGAEREVGRLSEPSSALGGTPDYEALLRLAKKKMLFVLSSDAYPRFCASPFYNVMLTALQSQPSERSGVLAPAQTEDAEGKPESKPDTSAVLRGDDDASPAVTAPSPEAPGALALPPPMPSTWLTRFIRIADLLPVCITLADVSGVVLAQVFTPHLSRARLAVPALAYIAPRHFCWQMTKRDSPIIYCNDSELSLRRALA